MLTGNFFYFSLSKDFLHILAEFLNLTNHLIELMSLRDVLKSLSLTQTLPLRLSLQAIRRRGDRFPQEKIVKLFQTQTYIFPFFSPTFRINGISFWKKVPYARKVNTNKYCPMFGRVFVSVCGGCVIKPFILCLLSLF